MIKQVIVGIKHKTVHERFLEKGEQFTFDEAIDIARIYEDILSQMKELDGESKKCIHGKIETRKRAIIRSRNALTKDSNILYSTETRAPHMALCVCIISRKKKGSL